MVVHVADSAAIELDEYVPAWIVNLVMGPQTARLREFSATHPNVQITTGHMWLEFFEKSDSPLPPNTRWPVNASG